MKERLLALWAKVVENKDTLVKAGSSAVGAAIGLVIATALITSSEEMLLEEVEMEPFEDEEVG